MDTILRRLSAFFFLAAALSGCGGGGGGGAPGGATGTRTALPQMVNDTNPVGETMDYRGRNYFPSSHGDTWKYDLTQGGRTYANAVTRSVNSQSDDTYYITETDSARSYSTLYLRGTNGPIIDSPLGDSASDTAKSLAGRIIEFPEPFFPVGTTRELVRQGSWDRDLDGDGIAESFRLEWTQTLVGFEVLPMPLGSVEAVHFHTVQRLSLSPSRLSNTPITLISTEGSWWGAGVGLVKAEREAHWSDGTIAVPPLTLNIASGRVSSIKLFDPLLDGTLKSVPLVHKRLIYDNVRNQFIASIPAGIPFHGSSIASVNPSTGNVTYLKSVDADPSVLALSNDGSALFVAFDSSGDVVKFRFPEMTEEWRVRLPQYTYAESISISPVDSNTIAVSLYAKFSSPRHLGVTLVRTGVLQNRTTQAHTGSNLITFDGDGIHLYGYNNETSEFGLRRIDVVPDGLIETQVQRTDTITAASSISWSSQGILIGAKRYRTSDLIQIGAIGDLATGCQPLFGGGKLVCLQASSGDAVKRLVIANSATYTTTSTPVFRTESSGVTSMELVPGPTGMVAIRERADFGAYGSATSIALFSSPLLN